MRGEQHGHLSFLLFVNAILQTFCCYLQPLKRSTQARIECNMCTLKVNVTLGGLQVNAQS